MRRTLSAVHHWEQTYDEHGLEQFARDLGSQLRGGELLLLNGPMGAGKTTFTRALGYGMGIRRPERVCSPTYTICMEHEGPLPLVHIDLFRLGEQGSGSVGEAAFESLGLEHDELPGPTRVMVVEWAELWGDPPREHLSLHFSRSPSNISNLRQLRVHAQTSHMCELLARWRRASDIKT